MNLFALTNNPASRILRFPMSQALQDSVQGLFRTQRNAFLNGIAETIDFDGRYRPDEGELLVIKNFVDVDGLVDSVKNPLGIEQFDPKAHSLETVKAIFAGCPDGGDQVLVQLFEQRRLIATKSIALFFSGNLFDRITESGLTLDSKLLAVLDGTDLKFQSFHFLRRVFDVDDHFKEATSAEVKLFAAHEKLMTADAAAFEAAASSTVRRKIALILQSGVLDKHPTDHIVATAKTFKLEIKTTQEGKIELPENQTDLRRLLRFLDEDYYESPLTQTQYVSNSKRVAD